MDVGHESPPIGFDCQVAAAMVSRRLEELGLNVVRSFDLSTAACVPRDELPCPHRGSVPCTCQLVVLLVYGKEGPPVSLIAHGYDNQAWFAIVEDPQQPADLTTSALVRHAFDGLSLGTTTPGVMGYAT